MNRIEHGGALAAACRAHGGRPEEWLDLSTGINPNPVPLAAIPAAAWHRLPDADAFEAARAAAARHYGTGAVLPLAIPGTQAAIQLLPQLVEGPEKQRRLAVVGPTYGEYARSFALRGWSVDSVDDIGGIDGNHSAAVIVNPNNPDGRVTARRDLLDLVGRMAAAGATLIVDEAFADLTPEISIAGEAGRRPGLILLRSFGKFFGLAGLRLGFVVAVPALLERMETLLGPWAVSGPALAVAAQMLDNSAGADQARRSIAERNGAMRHVLKAAGLTIKADAGLFLLVEHDAAAMVHAHLCSRHVLVRRFDYAPTWLRFGLTPDAEADERLAAALAEARFDSEG